MDEIALLQKYIESQDQDAFAQLVRQHEAWMYSAARRQLGDQHLAQDVTQAVFLMLARRAKRLTTYAYLGGWLFITLKYCVRDAIRHRTRLQQIEQEAAKMRSEIVLNEADWTEISPVIDEAVSGLRQRDREAVLLRFYQQKSLTEVGCALGISEEAARKRVERALDKLRGKLAKKGVTAGAAALGVVMAQKVTEAAPPGLTEAVTATVRAGGAGSADIIARGAIKMMAWAKLKVAAGVVVAAGLLTGAAITTQPSRGQPATLPAVQNEAAPPMHSEAVPGPRDTLAAFQRDIMDLKREAVRQAFATSGTQDERLADAMANYAMAAQALQNELAVRYPGEPRTLLPHMNSITVDKATEKIDGDDASVTLEGQQTPMSMKRVNGRWRMPIRTFAHAGADADVSHLIATAEQGTRLLQKTLEAARRSASFDELRKTYDALEKESNKGSQDEQAAKAGHR